VSRTFTVADEGLHPPGGEALWSESYYYDFADADASVGGYVRLGVYPNWGRAWYWACLVRPGEPAVMVADNFVPMPIGLPDGNAEVRGEGYRATQRISRPGQLVTLEVDADGFGLDLRWATAEAVYPYAATTRYEVPCTVDGSIRWGADGFALSGPGQRDHSWGERDWWSMSWLWTAGRLDDGTAFHGTQVNFGPPVPVAGYVTTPEGDLTDCGDFRSATTFGASGLPLACAVQVGDLMLTVVPVAYAPVQLESATGETAVFLRAMCRFESSDGRRGSGWTEWHQPPGWRTHDWDGFVRDSPPTT